MKALKFAVVAVFVSFTLMSFAQDFQKTTKPAKMNMITLSIVKGMPDVIYAINTQIDPMFFLTGGDHKLLVANVKVQDRAYRICGTYKEWYDFFYAKKHSIPFQKANKSPRKTD